MDRFCRGCLIRYEEPTELIQYTEKNRRLFVYSTGIQVKRTDTFTFQLCKDCYLNMKVACNFKKQCRNSDKRFKSYLGLKEDGENTDLRTFLKNTDDSWAFRFPGNSTPAYQRVKDEDNESTTTSICNFMMDIMPDDDLPDTEARIIKEVIDEEADVLDDSLDSHWLQDDASIDTDFNLSFSFSPFSTPRPVNNDRYTPKPTSSKVTIKKEKPEEIIDDNQVVDSLDMPLIDVDSNTLIPIKQERNYDETMDSLDTVNEFLENENNLIRNENDYIKIESENIDHVVTQPASQCTIDKNLENALKNTENKEFSLDQLLVSPKVIPGIKSPPTPLINNILFGEKLDMDENSNSSHKFKPGQTIETYEHVTGKIELTEEFSMDMKLEELDLEEIKTKMIDEIDEQANQINITNFYCNMCQKTFKNLRSLKQHYRRHFKDKSGTKFVCDLCGKQCNERTNFVRHLQTHTRPPPAKYKCDLCNLEFMSKNNLNQHKRTHLGRKRVVKSQKKYVCVECGVSMDKKSNLETHMRRHNKNFSHPCPECDKGFYRKAELTIHMRYHTGEKPFACTHCNMRFVRRDGLTRHVKWHLDLRPFQCQYCKTGFINNTDMKNHVKKSVICKATRDNIVKKQKKLEENSTTKSVVTEEVLVKKLKIDALPASSS